MEKFIKALEIVKAEGRWSLGLIVGDSEKVNLSFFTMPIEKIIFDGAQNSLTVANRISDAFVGGKWALLVVDENLPVGVYNLLKSLSVSNRFSLENNVEKKIPDNARLVVVASKKLIRVIEKLYPDFKFLFGPVINF